MNRPGDDEMTLTAFRLQELLMTAMVGHLPMEERLCLGEHLIAEVRGAVEIQHLSSDEDQMMSALVAATLMTLGQV